MVEKKQSSFKIVVLGEARVGKTSLTLRFCKGNFDEKQISTVDASCLSQTVTLGGGQKVTLSIWDTAGQERYHALNKVYYQGAEGALIVYDITDVESWSKVNVWVKELQRYLPQETPIIITGNKCDLPNRQIPLENAERYALEVGSQHFSSSAKSGTGVNEIFRVLSEKIIEHKKNKKDEEPKKKMNTRGALNIGGMSDFNPDANVRLTRESQAEVDKTGKGGKKRSGGCCK